MKVLFQDITNVPGFSHIAAIVVFFTIFLGSLLILPLGYWYVGLLIAIIGAGFLLFFILFFSGALDGKPTFALVGSLLGTVFGFLMFGFFSKYHPILTFLGLPVGGILGLFTGIGFYNTFFKPIGADQDELEAQELLDSAKLAEKTQDYEGAVANFKKYLESGKDKVPEATCFYIARILDDKLHQHDDAAYWYRRAVGCASRQNQPEQNLFARESRTALVKLKRLVGVKKEDVVENLVEARDLIDQGELEAALSMLEDLTRLYPQNPEVDYLTGHLNLRRNLYSLALANFGCALEKDADHHLAAFFIAETLETVEKLHEALAAYRKYVKQASEDPEESDRIALANDAIERIESHLGARFEIEMH